MIKKFTREEIASLYFNTSAANFSRKKEKYLNYFSQYFEWHKEGRLYVIDGEIQPWEPVKKGRPKISDEIQKEYTKMMHEIIDNNPSQTLNSGANLTRNAKKRNMNKFNHKDKTMSRYFCASINLEFPNAEKVWVKKRTEFEYELLSPEELESLNTLISEKVDNKNISKESLADAYASYIQNELTKEEAIRKLFGEFNPEGFYERVLMIFKDQWGFIPIRAKVLSKNEITF